MPRIVDARIDTGSVPTSSPKSSAPTIPSATTEKRADYAEAGIPEYWIVDPRDPAISVLTLERGRYAVHGPFRSGETAASTTIQGLRVPVSTVFELGATT